MKNKSILAIVLMFALMVTFCACQKLEDSGEYDVKEEVYITDSEGETKEVEVRLDEEGKTEYFYTDEKGEEVIVEKKEVSVEKKVVKNTETQTNEQGEVEVSLTPEQQSFIDSFNDDNMNLEDFVDEPLIDPNFQLGNELIDEKDKKNVKPASGTVVAPSPVATIEEVVAGKRYTISMTMKMVSGGEETIMPVTIMQNGDDLYIETSLPVTEGGNMNVVLLVVNGKCKMYVPKMRAYMNVPNDFIKELMDNFSLATEENTEMELIETFDKTIDGKTYKVEKYDNEGTEVYYFYDGKQLKRVEAHESEEDYSILEYTKISKSVVTSKFNEPIGYIDLTNLMGGTFDF